MPSLANLSIVKADGTTAVVWTGDSPSSGDKSPARYSSKTVNSIPAFQPKMSVVSEGSPDGKVRRVKIGVTYPYTVLDTTTNRTTEVAHNWFRGEWSFPQEIPTSVSDEFAAQVSNLLDHADIVSVLKTQQAPT